MTARILAFRTRRQVAETVLQKIGHVSAPNRARVVCPLCSTPACKHTAECLITRVKREMGVAS